MDKTSAPHAAIRVETDKIPQPLAERIGKAVCLATMAWMQQNDGKESNNGVS